MHQTKSRQKLVIACLLAVLSIERAHAEIKWNSKFTESYQSEATGRRVSFAVRSPPEVDGMEQYPLLIALSGGLRVSPGKEFPFFQANPTHTRSWGYRSMSTYDAMQVINAMKRKYPIDADRVYLMGFSAGGSGAMHLASCFPDVFAGVLPMVAAGNNYPLLNFRNLPVAFHHGDRDWTSAVCNVRVQVKRMKSLECPVVYREYKGAGHSVPGPHDPLMKWLFQQKRNPAPRVVFHDCEVSSLGRSYWFNVRELRDPHRRASVGAVVRVDSLYVRAENISAFSLDLNALPSTEDIKTIQINEAQYPVSSSYQFQDGKWSGVEQFPERGVRQYEAGAAASLYQGEPLLIVYGTSGDRSDRLKTLAQKLATFGGSYYATIPGSFPVVADTDLTPKQAARCNLVLVGTPDENRLTRALLPKLPIAIQDNSLQAGSRTELPLAGHVLSVVHPNPDSPQRLVCLLAPFTDEAGMATVIDSPMRFLAGSDGFDRISQPDLLVTNTRYQIVRQMQFDKAWKWIDFPGADKPIPGRYAERSALAMTYMKIMQEESKADLALWWGPADKGMWGADFNDLEAYDPEFYTMADLATQRRQFETTLASVSGSDLRIIWKRWGLNKEIVSFPAVKLDSIDDDREYRLHIPMDLYIKLGQRRKNLDDPQAGPPVSAVKVMYEVFGLPTAKPQF